MTDEILWLKRQGSTVFGRGLLVAARDTFQQWLDLVEPTGNPAAVIPALNALAAVAHQRGEMEEALAHLRRARTYVDADQTREGDRLRVHLNLMTMLTETGHLDEALDEARLAASLPLEGPLERVYWLNLGMLHWRRQEWALLRRAAERSCSLGAAAGDAISEAKGLINLGIADLELGDLPGAERNLTLVNQMERLDASEAAYVQAELGRLHFLKGDPGRAVECGRQALDILLTVAGELDREEVSRVSRLFGTIFAQTGQRNLALKYLNRAAAYFSQLGLHAEWKRSTDLIGQVLAQPVAPARRLLVQEAHRLDFLTATLDLVDDLESVDPFLRGHSERIAALAVLIGEAAGMAEEELKVLKHAARLHDVGMVAVDVELIQREGPLSESERQRVALHTTIGEEMLRPYGLSPAGLSAVRHHHERYDGQGWPDGLRGEQIPLAARVVTLADIYDALTSDRVYRRAMTHARALDELRAMSGRELDPQLVNLFVRLHEV